MNKFINAVKLHYFLQTEYFCLHDLTQKANAHIKILFWVYKNIP